MKSIAWLIVFILLIVIFLQRECTSDHQCPVCPDFTYDTIHDTIVYQTTVYTPQLVYRDTGSILWRSLPIDTSQIISDYFARNLYIDTIQNDTNAFIVLTDTISRNRVIYRYPQITLFPHHITETKLINVMPKLKGKVLLGVQLGRNPEQFSFSPSLMYQTKKETAISFSYDILNKDFFFSFYWPLRFKKKVN